MPPDRAGSAHGASGRIVIGTSSWADPGFVAEWYPKGLAPAEQLPYYAERFEAVEVNSTFYAVPAPQTVRRWAQVTPDGFTFDVKLHRPCRATAPRSTRCPRSCAMTST